MKKIKLPKLNPGQIVCYKDKLACVQKVEDDFALICFKETQNDYELNIIAVSCDDIELYECPDRNKPCDFVGIGYFDVNTTCTMCRVLKQLNTK